MLLGKLEEDLEGSSHGIGLGFKSVSEMKQGDNKPQEPIQISMSFSKVRTKKIKCG